MDYSLNEDISQKLINMASRVEGGIPDILLELGGAILEASGEQVPLDEGTLQDSGKVVQVDNSTVQIGYHTPYAARLHEHPEYNFKGGRKGKFLEDPIKNNLEKWKLKIAERLKKLINL